MTAGRRWAIIASGTVVALVAIVVGLTLAVQAPANYSTADQSRFMSACLTTVGEPARSTCACIYDELTRQVPYAQFVRIDDDLGVQRATGQTLRFPPTVDSIRTECVARSTLPPTTA